jgi:hypothetical protein
VAKFIFHKYDSHFHTAMTSIPLFYNQNKKQLFSFYIQNNSFIAGAFAQFGMDDKMELFDDLSL